MFPTEMVRAVTIDVEAVFAKLFRIQATGYMAVAAATVIFYDYILTIKNELSIAKKWRFTIPNVLFYGARYSALMFMIIVVFDMSESAPRSTEYCKIIVVVQDIFSLVVQTCVTVTMAMKTAVLWHNKRWAVRGIYIGLGITFVLCYAASVWVTIYLYKYIYFQPRGGFCLVDETPKLAWIIPVVQLVYDGYLTSLLCYKAYRETVALKSLDYIPLLKILFRYGLLYFVLIDGIKLAMSIVWAYLREAPTVFGPLYLDTALMAIINSRTLFSLRQSLEPDSDVEEDQTMKTAVPSHYRASSRFSRISGKSGKSARFSTSNKIPLQNQNPTSPHPVTNQHQQIYSPTTDRMRYTPFGRPSLDREMGGIGGGGHGGLGSIGGHERDRSIRFSGDTRPSFEGPTSPASHGDTTLYAQSPTSFGNSWGRSSTSHHNHSLSLSHQQDPSGHYRMSSEERQRYFHFPTPSHLHENSPYSGHLAVIGSSDTTASLLPGSPGRSAHSGLSAHSGSPSRSGHSAHSGSPAGTPKTPEMQLREFQMPRSTATASTATANRTRTPRLSSESRNSNDRDRDRDRYRDLSPSSASIPLVPLVPLTPPSQARTLQVPPAPGSPPVTYDEYRASGYPHAL